MRPPLLGLCAAALLSAGNDPARGDPPSVILSADGPSQGPAGRTEATPLAIQGETRELTFAAFLKEVAASNLRPAWRRRRSSPTRSSA